MRRHSTPEILDSETCPAREVETSLRDLCRMNRWFGGVATTRRLIQRVSLATGRKRFSMLDVASGYGEVPKVAGKQLARQQIMLEVTMLDRLRSHLLPEKNSVVADALALPFADGSFDLVSCSLFAHHLEPAELARFATEALRVSRYALLINDLIRHPLHMALIYAGFPLMRSHVSRVDGIASVKRAYSPREIHTILGDGLQGRGRIHISRHYLFRMGIIAWK